MCANKNWNKRIKEAKNMCDINYEYYTKNLKSLLEKYPNKFIVIKNSLIIGVYDTFEQAYNNTIKTEALGSFLIQHCSADENNVNYFHSNNVVFA